MIDSGYAPQDLYRIPWRHRYMVFSFGVAIVSLAIVALAIWPRTYVSEAKIFVRLGRESVTLDPTTKVGNTISLNESRENEINSALEVLQSRELAMRVVDALGPMYVSDPNAKLDVPPSSPWIGTVKGWVSRGLEGVRYVLGNDQRPDDVEKAVTRLQKRIHIEASTKRSNVITASCTAKTPESAQRVLQTLLDAYLTTHVRINQADGSLAFFEQQTQLLHDQLAAAKAKLRDAKNQGEMASLEGMRDALEGQLTQLATQIATTRSESEASRAMIGGLEKILASVPEQLVAESEDGYDNVAADEMRALLYELQILEKDLQAKFTSSHPRVTAIRSQVESAMKIVEGQGSARTRTTRAPNPAHQELQLQLLQQRARLAGLEAQLQSLCAERDQLNDRTRKLNEHEITIVDLTRQVALMEESYTRSFEALEQSRISAALEKERISNVSILQQPTLVVKPSSPKTFEVLALACFLGSTGGLALAFLLEKVRSTVRSAEDVERQLEIPVLGTLPYTSHAHAA